MSFFIKKISTLVVLVAFLMAVFFGFAAMTSGQNGQMQGGCPFSATGASLCPQNSFDAALHHLSAYQSFLNVPIGFGIVALLAALLVVSVALIFFTILPLPSLPRGLLYESPPLVLYNKKLLRWLALFEHTPR